jgi:hypothetical protein
MKVQKRRVLIGGAGLAGLGAGYGWYYWTVGRFHAFCPFDGCPATL